MGNTFAPKGLAIGSSLQMVARQPGGGGAATLTRSAHDHRIGMRVFGPGAGGGKLDVGAEIERGAGRRDLLQPRPVGRVDEARGRA
jgi:hypothetical protein